MSTTSKNRDEKLQGPETLRACFGGTSEGVLRAGAEQEFMLMKRTREGRLYLVSDYENFCLMELAAASGKLGRDSCSNEPPSSMFELKTPPYEAKDIVGMIEQMNAEKAALVDVAANLTISAAEIADLKYKIATGRTQLIAPEVSLSAGELMPSPFAVLPYATSRQMIANLISPRGAGADYSDRPRLLLESFRRSMSARALPYPFTNTAVHFTHGVRDMKHAFEMSRLQAALMPFLFVLTENRPPYQNASGKRVQVHTGIAARMALNIRTDFNKVRRGLFPEMLWEGDEKNFRDRLIDLFLNTPMFAYTGHDGKFMPAPPGAVLTPLSMKGLGPQTVSQFEQAMSQFWWCFKYKLHPKEKGALLHELRDFDSGPATVKNIGLIMAMLSLHDAPRAALIDILDRKYGLPVMRTPIAAAHVINDNMAHALHRGSFIHNPKSGGRFMKSPFGRNGHTMLDFLREDLLPMMEAHYAGQQAALEKLDTLRFIARTGMTDAQLWFDRFGSPAAQRKALLDMTADAASYGAMFKDDKSWAQHEAEGRMAFLPSP